jgi:hypothetical protein
MHDHVESHLSVPVRVLFLSTAYGLVPSVERIPSFSHYETKFDRIPEYPLGLHPQWTYQTRYAVAKNKGHLVKAVE